MGPVSQPWRDTVSPANQKGHILRPAIPPTGQQGCKLWTGGLTTTLIQRHDHRTRRNSPREKIRLGLTAQVLAILNFNLRQRTEGEGSCDLVKSQLIVFKQGPFLPVGADAPDRHNVQTHQMPCPSRAPEGSHIFSNW